MATLTIDPITRVEGHLGIEVTVEPVGGQQTVVDAESAGTMFRGFEAILLGRDPRDATHYTQRVCGVCPVSHGMACSLALEAAFGVIPPRTDRSTTWCWAPTTCSRISCALLSPGGAGLHRHHGHRSTSRRARLASSLPTWSPAQLRPR